MNRGRTAMLLGLLISTGCQELAMADLSTCTQEAVTLAAEPDWPQTPTAMEGRWEAVLDGGSSPSTSLQVTSAAWAGGWSREEWWGPDCAAAGSASYPYRDVTASLELPGIAWSDVDVQVRDGGEVWWVTVIDADYVPGSSPGLDAMLLNAIPATYGADIALDSVLLTFEGRMGETTAQLHGQVSATGSVRDGTESIQGTLSRVPGR